MKVWILVFLLKSSTTQIRQKANEQVVISNTVLFFLKYMAFQIVGDRSSRDLHMAVPKCCQSTKSWMWMLAIFSEITFLLW